jgi:hypothetical protein
VAIDPSTARRPISGDLPPDENVVSTYRAISPLAIASLVFGIAAILSFLSMWFAISGALAVASGILAIRAIHRLPEALTGERMANVGISLGLLFSLAAVTISLVQVWIIRREAAKFARSYVEAVQSGSLANVMYLHADAAFRKDKTPAENLADLHKAAGKPGMFDTETRETQLMLDRIKSTPDQKVSLARILRQEVDGLNAYAEALLVLEGPKSAEFPAETQYALISLRGYPEGRLYGWKVGSVKFPYSPPPGGF